ncbi:hypothetical protein U9M48_039178 [Paspalum notatum var. saurae]|uniref:Reverse transcriptase n=1 Tax=Paspalum notatum var. saurae TaxID=547442 RepID=A0AAQ3XCY7_PASNO
MTRLTIQPYRNGPLPDQHLALSAPPSRAEASRALARTPSQLACRESLVVCRLRGCARATIADRLCCRRIVEDKNNSNLNRAMMGKFRRFINDLALKEITLHGWKFTWSNGQDSPTLVKLDRMLCTLDWEDLFPNCLLQSAASSDSDHCPLVLGLGDRSTEDDIRLTLDILSLFGDALGLQTNVQKSCVFPIQCNDEQLELVQENLPCKMEDFPCNYLGLPLSLKKLLKAQVQSLIDKIADQLPGWKAELMTRAGRAIQVQFVLTAMTIYFSMAVDLPQWAIKAIDKIRRGFLWRGRKDAKGDHCLIAWDKVQCPKELGGLGISNLQRLGWALRLRWLWLQKTDPDRPWSLFPIKLQDCVHAFFSMAVETIVGDGGQTLFWKDSWLHGQKLEDLAPNLFASVPTRRVNRRTVKEALSNQSLDP